MHLWRCWLSRGRGLGLGAAGVSTGTPAVRPEQPQEPGDDRISRTAGTRCGRRCLRECGPATLFSALGRGARRFIHLFDPERIIVGGGAMNEPASALASFRQTVDELAWMEEGQVEIVVAEHPDQAGLSGAEALFHAIDR